VITKKDLVGFKNLLGLKKQTMQLEPLKNSQYYHFYNRGNNKETIFFEEENYVYFLNLIKVHLLQIADFYSYCLLPNHFHFVFKIKGRTEIAPRYKDSVHQPFSNFFNAYTKAFNKKYNRTGSLFQKHPKRIMIKNDDYLRNLILYVNTNSSHHDIANYERYRFSSFQTLISDKPTALKRLEVINLFDNLDNFKYAHKTKKIRMELIKDAILE
jgi:REP element-mobilizing transposase RayT